MNPAKCACTAKVLLEKIIMLILLQAAESEVSRLRTPYNLYVNSGGVRISNVCGFAHFRYAA